ncbi:unnamed protein product [Eruca vesicaria subsp. sativa]|uniref:PXA domain-containing protein n=1 Tax=Eruca vesicaria subsp. sativa TaxID=29727 RepID=A0ABC8L2Z9_ERUVS|nr:unnamed protein product [Eruca vesicaria subsp. sativa]
MAMMETTINDLIEESKVRTARWALCIFFLTYFLTHASMWMNLPMAVVILCSLQILLTPKEFRSRGMPDPRQSHLYYRGRKQLSFDDPRLSTTPPPSPRWKKKIYSPVVEVAINDFVDKIIDDNVNSWYSKITPDKEFPELIRGVIMNALGEISARVKKINIVGLIRDIVDLMGDHLDSFRRNQAAVGTDLMKTLSSGERDKMLKGRLMASGELYTVLVSKESVYKVLPEIVSSILSLLLRPQEYQCPLVRTIARDILTSLVVQPLVDFASPEHINVCTKQFLREEQSVNHAKSSASDNQAKNINLTKVNEQKTTPSTEDESNPEQEDSSDWAQMPEVATQRRKALHIESQHCLKLKFRDLLSIANFAEQHEVWDFLSEFSKNYSFGESSSANVISVPILNLVDKVFQLNKGCWLRRQAFELSKNFFVFTMEDAVDGWLLMGIYCLWNEDKVAHGIRWAQDILWPKGVDDGEEALDQTDPSEETFQMAGQLGGEKVVEPSSFEQQLEAVAIQIKKFFFDTAPKTLVRFVKEILHMACPRDILYFTQSNICIKQLAIAILELIVRTVFPELQALPRMADQSNIECSLS